MNNKYFFYQETLVNTNLSAKRYENQQRKQKQKNSSSIKNRNKKKRKIKGYNMISKPNFNTTDEDLLITWLSNP